MVNKTIPILETTLFETNKKDKSLGEKYRQTIVNSHRQTRKRDEDLFIEFLTGTILKLLIGIFDRKSY